MVVLHFILHAGSVISNSDVVKFLMGLDTESLMSLDRNENLPLHSIAGLGGRCNEIIWGDYDDDYEKLC